MGDWTRKQQRYIEWLALPKKAREPKIRAEMAKELGVGERTLYRWQTQEGFWDAVYGEARARLDKRLPSILDALADEAESGNVPAVKLALGVTGRHEEKKGGVDVTVNVDILQDKRVAFIIANLRDSFEYMIDELVVPEHREQATALLEGTLNHVEEGLKGWQDARV